MQLRKWFCYSFYKKLVAILILTISSGIGLSAQEIINHKVEKDESLYKLSILYLTSIDSIKSWNNLSSEILLVGSTVIIKDYYGLEREELMCNLAIYQIRVKETEKFQNEEKFKVKLQELAVQKDAVDVNQPSAMQVFFKIAKQKKLYADSISIVNDSIDLQIRELEKERDQWGNLFQKNHEKKYKQREKLWQDVTNVYDLDEQYAKAVSQKIEELNTPSEITPNTNDFAENKSKELANKIEGKEQEMEKAAIERAALQKKQEEETLAAMEKAKKEKEVLSKEDEEKRIEQEALAKKLQEEKARQQEIESKRIKEEIEAALKEEKALQLKYEAKEDSITAYLKAKDSAPVKELSPLEKELAAMEAAKQKAKGEKTSEIPKEVKEKLEKKVPETVAKLEEKNEIETLKFDVSFDERKEDDKKDQKQKDRQAKELAMVKQALEKDSLKVARNIDVPTVNVVETKKNKKLKMGDEVDKMRQEKGRFFLSRAKIEIDKGNYKKAFDYTDKSIGLNPNYTEAYMLKADMLASLGYYDKAFVFYEKANMLNDQIPQLHYNMGNCLIFLGKKEKALEKMGDAIKLDPEYILAYAGRSALYIDLKKYRSALNDYNKILEINKYFYPALRGRGIAQLNLGNYQDAIRDFNELLEYEPDDASVFYHRGMAKMYLSEIYGACMDFLSSSERGFSEADKAMRKYCD